VLNKLYNNCQCLVLTNANLNFQDEVDCPTMKDSLDRKRKSTTKMTTTATRTTPSPATRTTPSPATGRTPSPKMTMTSQVHQWSGVLH
jgi:hypothetical protein